MPTDKRLMELASAAAEAAGKNANVAPQLLVADIYFTLNDAVENGRISVTPTVKCCDGKGWYTSFSGGFAHPRPCDYCNPKGLPEQA